MLRVFFLALAFVTPLGTALAQDAPDGRDDEQAETPEPQSAEDAEARGLFTAGEAAYNDGRFEDAYGYFRHAYELSGRATLLYNVGLSAANAGHEREALDAFERYLAEVSDAQNRAIVESRIEALRRTVAEDESRARELDEARERARRESEAADRARAEAATGGSGARTAGWALVVGGGVALVAGGVLFGVGLADVSTVENADEGTPWVDLQAAYDRAPVLTTIGLVAGGVGIAAVATGLVLVLTSPSGEVEVAASGTGLSVRGSF